MGRVRVLLGVAGIAALAGVGVAVVTAQDRADELSLIAKSVDAVADAGTFRADFEMTVDVPGPDGGTVTMRGDGEFDQTARTGKLAMAMDIPGAGFERFEMQILMVDTVMYMNLADLGEEAGFPTPWASIDMSVVPGFADLMNSEGFGNNDPTQFLEYLRGAGKATVMGEEDVRGVSTTHYSSTANFGDALEAAPDEEREALEKMFASLPDDVDLTNLEFPMEVWLDADGLPHRMTMEFDMADMAPDVPEGTSMTVSMEMFDYGVAVNVQPPPADQVTDMTDEATQGMFG